jgi:DNA-binding NtrC family response regulator
MPRQQLDQVEGGVERSSGNTVKMTDLRSRVAQERERLQAVERLVSLAEIERKTILSTLELCRGSREETAQRLGISISTLYRRLAEYRRDPKVPVQGQIRGVPKTPSKMSR